MSAYQSRPDAELASTSQSIPSRGAPGRLPATARIGSVVIMRQVEAPSGQAPDQGTGHAAPIAAPSRTIVTGLDDPFGLHLLAMRPAIQRKAEAAPDAPAPGAPAPGAPTPAADEAAKPAGGGTQAASGDGAAGGAATPAVDASAGAVNATPPAWLVDTHGESLAADAIAEADRQLAKAGMSPDAPVSEPSSDPPEAAALPDDAEPPSTAAAAPTSAPGTARASTTTEPGADERRPAIARMAAPAAGVRHDAADAVDAATASVGVPLPGRLMRKFEASLGADLGAVRIHSGAASIAATRATGARAYTLGQDIHFNAGEFAPDTTEGEALLAHEVAHTVQQGPGLARKAQLEVSSPGDACETEADEAARAMVAGEPAAVSPASGVARRVMRAPNSYSAQKGNLKWNNGQALADDEAEQFVAKQASYAGKAVAVATKLNLLGCKVLTPSAVFDNLVTASSKHQQETETITQNIAFIQVALVRGRYTAAEIPGVKRNLDRLTKLLAEYKKSGHANWYDLLQSSIQIASQVNSVAKSFMSNATQVIQSTGNLVPEKFGDISSFLSHVDTALTAIDLASEIGDTTAIDAFMAHPSLATCEAWAGQVGAIFTKIGGLASGLPAGMGVVLQGALSMPAVVTQKFIEMQDKYFARLDAAVGSVGPAQLLPEGAEGTPETIGR